MPPQKEEPEDDPVESLRELHHLISMSMCNTDDDVDNNNDNNNNNIREPRSSSSSSSVHFPPDDLLITSIHTRPCTDINDIPTLYYSSDDIKHFKQTYKDRAEQLALLYYYGNTNMNMKPHDPQFMYHHHHRRQQRQQRNSSSVSPKKEGIMITADQLLTAMSSRSRRVNNNIQRRQPAVTTSFNTNNNAPASEEVIFSYEDLTSYDAPDISSSVVFS